MKHSLQPLLGVFLVTLLIWAQNSVNPVRAALLRWYPADQVQTFGTCADPQGVAFDGAHIWVACHGANAIEEFNVSDGASVRTVADSIKLLTPQYLLYDGANIWVSNASTSAGMLTKVRARDGAILNTYRVGSGPEGMAFDGAAVWVANYATASVSKLDVGTDIVTNYPALSDCRLPSALGFDGSHIWVNCYNGHGKGAIQELDLNGNLLHRVTVGAAPYNFAFDGTNIWVVNVLGHSVSKVAAVTTGSCSTPPCFVATYPVGKHPQGIVFDGRYIWVSNATDVTLTKLVASTGAVAGTIAAGSSPGFIALDGSNAWVTQGRANTVSKF
jgi:DNA-binding beta-propeller fold protein YncE